MDCKFDKFLLQDLLDGVIDPVEKIFLEEHLKVCKECRKEMTALKLLFWDLDNKDNYDVEIPQELDLIKDAVLRRSVGKAQKNIAGMVIEQQRETLKISSKFLEYVPGVKEGGKLLKEGARATPSVIRKASMHLVKGTKGLLAK